MHAIFHIRLFYINRLKWKTKPLLLHSIYRPRLTLCYQLATYLFPKQQEVFPTIFQPLNEVF